VGDAAEGRLFDQQATLFETSKRITPKMAVRKGVTSNIMRPLSIRKHQPGLFALAGANQSQPLIGGR